MKRSIVAFALWTVALGYVALADGTPKIQFDTTVFDFGKTSQVETVSGSFKFKNAGDAVLKVEQPKTTCGCTVASLKKDTLQPGEIGEIPFTLSLGRAKALLQKHITVTSNDPQTPQVSLTVKADYTPLFDIAPTTLAPNIPLGGIDTNQFLTITRTDGKPLPPLRFQTSKPWITARIEPGNTANDASVRVRVGLQPDGQPRRFNEFIQVYPTDQTNTPLGTVFVYGRLMGDLTLTPEAFYWSVTDVNKIKTERPEALITRRVTIKSNKSGELMLKNPVSSVKGISLELVPREWKKPVQAGKPEEIEKGYELVAKLNEIPEKTVTGMVTFETSSASQPKVDVPVTIYVYQPPAVQPQVKPTIVQPAPQPRILTNAVQRTVALPTTPPPIPAPSK